MIKIHLKFKVPWETREVDEERAYAAGTTLEKVLQDLGIETTKEGNFLLVVNGKIECKSYLLQDGDQVSVLSALIGG
ncbi:MAG: MoaD/ThiS family protein [Peptococcales bacterium]|jgi:sulfur carrier protein ThiS